MGRTEFLLKNRNDYYFLFDDEYIKIIKYKKDDINYEFYSRQEFITQNPSHPLSKIINKWN